LPPAVYGRFRLSPDARRVAVEVITSPWTVVYDGELSTGIITRLSRSSGTHFMPTWSPDGRYIVYGSGQSGARNLVMSSPGGAGAESVLAKIGDQFNMPNSWSPNGRFLLFRRLRPETQDDVWTLPLEGERRPRPFLAGPARESDATVSPDGRWVAYVSDESGRRELYVCSYPEADRRVRVSRRGAGEGRRGLGLGFWRSDGRALVYLDGDQVTVMEVPVKLGEHFSFGEPHALFRLAPGMETPSPTAAQDRFLVLVDTEAGSRSALRVNTNWRGLLPAAR
jgi:Tol biopolymer transport system component